MHPVQGVHSALEIMQANAPGHKVPWPGPHPWKLEFLAVESKMHAFLEQPGPNQIVLFCLKVAVQIRVLLCVCT